MANPVDLSALILSVARSCDEAIRTLKKSNAEVELDQVEMTVTVEADIDDEVLRAPRTPGATVLPGLRLDLKSRVLPTRPTTLATATSGDVTGKIELRLLLSRKE